MRQGAVDDHRQRTPVPDHRRGGHFPAPRADRPAQRGHRRKALSPPPPVTIAEGDALDVPLPDGDLVVFIYHSFGPDVLARVIDRLGDAALREARDVFVVYENPVYGTVVDRHRAFRRWFAEHVLCDPAEAPFQSDDGETIVI